MSTAHAVDGELLGCPLCGSSLWEQKWICQVRLGPHKMHAIGQQKTFECTHCSHRVFSTTTKKEKI